MIQPLKRPMEAVHKIVLVTIALFLTASTGVPVYVYADDSSATAPKCSPVVTDPVGVSQPNGADAVTYTYNSCTGLWENPHYTWNPNTNVKTPVPWPTYTCNPSTNKWEALIWVYSPSKLAWYQSPVAVDSPPAGAPKIDCPPVSPQPSAASTSSQPSSGNTAQGSTASTTSNTDTTNNTTNNALLSNQISGSSQTGNAIVIGNTSGGSAGSGDAQSIANVVNMLQSSTSLGSNTVTFVANINGDVQGDLLLDPSFLQPAGSASTINTTASNNLTLNTGTNGQIVNDITLSAASGDATVSKNTTAGDATTGNAQAIANIVNVLNSLVSAKQSFVGVININGNLTGNILVPQSFLDSLIASNAPHTTVSVSTDTLNALNANVTNNQSIQNNISSDAQTGTATVTKNTSAGTATSGNASSKVTLFDLTSDHIMASNTMVVFVNVLGNWVGLIMNAPAGTTAAAIGGGVTKADTNLSNTATANITNNQSIVNNVDVTAKSGNADVSYNTKAGNALSGNADTAVNILNIVGSDLNLSNWFGVLFINVFGNWYGNFGVAQPPVTKITGSHTTARQPQPSQTFSFMPYSPAAANKHTSKTSAGSGGGADLQHFSPALVKAAQQLGTARISYKNFVPAAGSPQNASYQAAWLGGGLLALGALLLIADRAKMHRDNSKL